MIKTSEILKDNEILRKYIQLEQLNRLIDIDKISALPSVANELVQEFISTNNIEGDIVTFSKAKEFLREDEVLSKDQLQRRWIGIKRAHGVAWKESFMLNEEFIKEIHRALMRDTDITGGVYKQKMNKVGSLYTSIPQDVPMLMKNIINETQLSFLTDGNNIFNIVQFISEFLAIHPFEDGNGRTSRLLFNRMMFDAGYKFAKYISISKFIWEKKDEYIKSLEARNNDWASNNITFDSLRPLFILFLDVCIDACRKATDFMMMKKYTKQEFERQFLVYASVQEISFNELSNKLRWSNSDSLIIKWINELVNENKIKRVGKNKGTKYIAL